MSDDILLHKIFHYIKEEGQGLYIHDLADDFDGTVVDQEFEKGGRWSNYRHSVVEIQGRFFRITEDVPATEMQEGQGGETDLVEVVPETKTVVVYVNKPGAESLSHYSS